MEIVDKVALITGGASGIGRAIGTSLARRGARVVIADIDENAADDVVSSLVSQEMRAISVELDVASQQSWEAARAKIEDVFGPVDILCNNAGVGTARKPLDQLSERDWAFVFDVNVRGVINGIRNILPSMRQRQSDCHIVNTGSVLSFFALDGAGDYVASKYAVLGISETLALELRNTRIGVSVLCPGLVDTPIAQNTSRRTGRAFDPNPSDRLASKPAGLDPAVVGNSVAAAIQTGQFFIFTHPEYGEYLVRREEVVRQALCRSPSLGTRDDTTFLARAFQD